MTAPARSREEAYERLEAAFREGEERCLAALPGRLSWPS